MVFGERIAKAVQQRAGLSDKQYCDALQRQESTIIEFLSFTCYEETETLSEVINIKNEILRLYTERISLLISKGEVYSHDLSAGAVEGVYGLLQHVIAAEFPEQPSEMKKFYDIALSYTYWLLHELQKTLLSLYFDRIKEYDRMTKNFNSRGVLIDNAPVTSVIKNKVKEAKRKYKSAIKRLRTRIHIDNQQVVEIDLQLVDKDVGFDGLIGEVEAILQEYEKALPNIISNGYNMPAAYRFVSTLISIGGGIFLVVGVLQALGLWKPMISYFFNLFNGVGI